MKSITKPHDMDIYIPLCIPANWTVVRNELLRDFLNQQPISLRWEWLFSAVYSSKGFNIEVQLLGNHCELGIAVSGVVLRLDASSEKPDSELELMVIGPQYVNEEEAVRKLTNSLFEFSLRYLDDLRSTGRNL
jgi:hypothetical protein